MDRTCAPGAVLVIPLKGTLAGGSIAWLKKLPDGTASGRLMHTPAAFMPLLSDAAAPDAAPDDGPAGRTVGRVETHHRTSVLTPGVLDDWTFSFFAQLHLAPTPPGPSPAPTAATPPPCAPPTAARPPSRRPTAAPMSRGPVGGTCGRRSSGRIACGWS
ncbi:hypothetical protein [Embleya scabrispora]|uniref:hypothetical protein n=1 Tax=Embleya scabrispora TaxID=159449 RepID=UPI001374DF76|nr:hypothetical protein [Embleya scabrispora]